MAWIAGELADRGVVVVAPNHPGTTSGDSLPLETVKVWQRPADPSAVIDHALTSGFGDIDLRHDAIGVVGFSLGGYTAMAVAGAQVNAADYANYCDSYAYMLDCKWLAAGGVDFQNLDRVRFEQANRDPRLTFAVTIDPALSQAYAPASLAAIDMPVLMINLGVGPQVPAAIDAANLVGDMGNGTLVQVPQATHFSFLGECTAKGRVLAKLVEPAPICDETGNRARSDIHRELKSVIGDFVAAQTQN